MKDDLQKWGGNERRPKNIMENSLKKMKTTKIRGKKKKTSKKNLFLIPLKFRGKPFLGLAQLSKIFLYIFILKSNLGTSKVDLLNSV
jgi:hypothetical protein